MTNKKLSLISRIIILSTLLSLGGVLALSGEVKAVGLSVGYPTAQTLTGTENLIYGLLSSSSTGGNYLNFEKLNGGVYSTIFKIDYNGNITTTGQIVGSNTLWTGTLNGNIWNGAAGVGNVGIGTSAPGAYKLNVTGGNTYLSGDLVVDSGDISNGNVSLDLGEANANGALFSETNDNAYFDIFCADSGGNDLCEFRTGIFNNGGTFYNQNPLIQRAAITNDSAAYLHIGGGTAGTIYLNGNVGVGLTNPAQKLDVNGMIKTSSNLVQGNTIVRPLASWSASGTATGAVIITLPGTAGTNYGMVQMEINVYEYNGSSATTFICGGHNWSTQWYNYNCSTVGFSDKKVRLGVKDGKYVVVIGEPGVTWSYGHVVLSKITNPEFYTSNMSLSGPYTVTLDNNAEAYTWISGDLNRFSARHAYFTGNIGMGISAPTSKIHFNTTSAAVMQNLAGGRIIGLEITPVNANEATSKQYVDNNFAPIGSASKWTDGASGSIYRMSNVGIGVSAPLAKFDVIGPGKFRAGTAGALQTNLELGEFVDSANTPLYQIKTDDSGGDILEVRSARWAGDVRFTRGGASGDRFLLNIQGSDGGGANLYVYDANNVNTVAIRGNGTTYFNGGSVGVGTTNPGAKLHVVSASTVPGNRGQFTVGIGNGTGNGNLDIGFNSASTYAWLQPTVDGVSYNNLILNPSGGNVGIGTTNPNHKLDVSGAGIKVDGGTSNATNDATLYVTATNNNDWGLIVNKNNGSATEYGLRVDVGASATYGMRLMGGGAETFRVSGGGAGYFAGNVAIGTTAQTSKLKVSNGTNEAINVSGGHIGGLNSSPVNSDHAVPKLYVDNNFAPIGSSWAAGANGSVYRGTGNVGVGTSNPSQKIEVTGGIIRQSGYNVSDAATDNLVVNGDFEMDDKYGWNAGTVVTGGYSGNKALQITGSVSLNSDDYIPVDPTRDILQLEAWVKKSVAGTTPGVLYFGYYAYDANKTMITSAPCGSYCYFAASGYVIPVDGNWHKVAATTTGEGTSNPNFPVGTRYVRILGLVNYSASGDAVTLVDHVTLKRLPKGPLIAGDNFSSTNLTDRHQYSKLYTTTSNHLILEPPSGGNVGVGTTAPSQKLHVVGNIRTSGDIISDGNYGLGLVGVYDSARYQNVFAMGASYRLAADGTTPGNLHGIAWTHTNVGGQSKSGLSHQALFMTNGVTQTAIGTGIWTQGGYTQNGTAVNSFSGNVGIGQTAPTYKLHFGATTGNVIYTGGGQISGLPASQTEDGQAVSRKYLHDNFASSATALWGGTLNGDIWNGTAGVGSVGVGITSPVSLMHIHGSTPVLTISNSASTAGTVLGKIVGRGTGYNFSGPGISFEIESDWAGGSYPTRMTFLTSTGASASERMRITSAGNVGIGTTNPTQRLEVSGNTVNSGYLSITGGSDSSGNIRFSTANPYITASSYTVMPGGLYVSGGTLYATNQAQFRGGIHNDTAAYLTLAGGTAGTTYVNGNVGIGTTNPGSAKLEVVGSSVLANNTTIDPDSYANKVIAGAINDGSGWGIASAVGGSGGTGHSWGVGTNGTNFYMGYGNQSAVNTMQTFLQVAGRNVALVPTSGNVGVGSTNPTAKLFITANTAYNGNESALHGIQISSGTVSGDNYLYMGADKTNDVSYIQGGDVGAYKNLTLQARGGNVGVGLINPSSKLEVLGTLTVSTSAGNGLGAIKAGTFDPPYTIEGVKYATYLPSMTGVKEETTGTVKLAASEKSGLYLQRLTLLESEPGSDLWLFSKVTDIKNKGLDSLSVLLSPHFEGTTWYEKDTERGLITIYARPLSKSSVLEVSYRLTAPRFDEGTYNNRRPDDDPVEGFNLDQLIK